MCYIVNAAEVNYADFCSVRYAEVISITWKSQDQRVGLYCPIPDIIAIRGGAGGFVVRTNNGRSKPSNELLEMLMLPRVWKGVANPMSFASCFRNYLKKHFKYVPSKKTLKWDFWLYSFLEDGQSREQCAKGIGRTVPQDDLLWDWSERLDGTCTRKMVHLSSLIQLDYDLSRDSDRRWHGSSNVEGELGPPRDPEDEYREEVRQYQEGIAYEDIHYD